MELLGGVMWHGKGVVLTRRIVQIDTRTNVAVNRTVRRRDVQEKQYAYTVTSMMAIPRLIWRIWWRVASFTSAEPASAPASVTAFAPRSRAAKKAVGSMVASTLEVNTWILSTDPGIRGNGAGVPDHQERVVQICMVWVQCLVADVVAADQEGHPWDEQQVQYHNAYAQKIDDKTGYCFSA